MALVRVPIANTVGKSVRINTEASVGATIGQDLRLPDGTVPSLTELAAALAIQAVTVQQGTQLSSDYIYWNQILGDYDFIQFDVTAACIAAEGKLCWNTEDGTLQVGMPGGAVNLQIGQEQMLRCRNETGVTIANGAVVRITGASGNKPLIALADATDLSTANVLGFATEEILHNANGYVTTTGLVRDVNTAGMTAGDLVFLSETAGAFTDVHPTKPAVHSHIGHVIAVHATEGVVLALMEDPVEMPDLVGIDLGGQLDNDMLHLVAGIWTPTAGDMTWDGSNLHALAFGGIAEADLLDKGAGESVTGDWVFSGLMTVPVATVTAHQAALTIVEGQITGAAFTNWNTAFGWGDHDAVGYLTSIPTHTGDVTGDTALTAAAAMISGKALVTAVATDMVLIWDATDSALKRVDANDFLSGGGSVSMAQLSARIIGAM